MGKSFFAACSVFFGLFFLPVVLCAEAPLETIRTRVDDMLNAFQKISKEREVDHAAHEGRLKELRSCTYDIFDFTELSIRTLGQDWRKLDETQREEFVSLFSSLLERIYMDKILSYTDQHVTFHAETIFSENRAEVQSDICTKSRTIHVDYRMRLRNGQWKVYDVLIEGVSLIENYRSQFRRILTNNSPEDLLKMLREKVLAA